MPVVGPPMHFAAGDDVDAGDLLLEDRGLSGPQLRIGEIAGGKLIQRYEPVQASYQRGTLCAPTTVVVYFWY